MMRVPAVLRRVASGIAWAVIAASGTASADPIADFYKGKTVRVVIGYGEGGGYDLYGRLAAQHLGRHIPGGPTVIAQNMPGAGSKIAARHIYAAAPKDGTYIGIVSQAIANDALIEGAVTKDFDVTKFAWLGRITSNVDLGVTLHSSSVKSFDDARAREVVIGGLAAGTNSVMVPRLLNAVAGTKFKIIQGYKGSAEVTLAAERGEVDAIAAIGLPGIKSTRPDWLGDKRMNVLYQVALKRHPELPNAPALGELGGTPDGNRVLRFIASSSDVGRSLFVAPDVPPERLAALRKAFAAMLADPEFKADTDRRRIEVDPLPPDKLADIILETMATPKTIVDQVKQAMEAK
jgi:tripartite-type tricarboxylate transporter receptor subunit TctC